MQTTDESKMNPQFSSPNYRHQTPQNSTISSDEDHASINAQQGDWDTQATFDRREVGMTALENDEFCSEALKEKGRRRRSRKSRATREMKMDGEDGMEADQMGSGTLGNDSNLNAIPNGLAPGLLPSLVPSWACYALPAFMIMMPLPVVPIVPTFGPSQWTNINSGNVTHLHMYDSANNNSTNLSIRKGIVLSSSVIHRR
jgi:hypothetical protein